jgi:Immunity protein 50
VIAVPTMVRWMPEIERGDLVTDVFGRWPSFHDAEVLRLRLDHEGPAGPWLEADIYAFEMTSEIDERGLYVLDKQHVVTLRFDGLVGLDVRWFSQQNVISTLAIETAADVEEPAVRWHVDIGSSVGMEAEFNCASVRVVGVEPVAI